MALFTVEVENSFTIASFSFDNLSVNLQTSINWQSQVMAYMAMLYLFSTLWYTDYTQYTLNQLCKCDDSLDYVGRPPVLANVCKRSMAIANLEHSHTLCTATIYLIYLQHSEITYDLRTSKIQNFLWPQALRAYNDMHNWNVRLQTTSNSVSVQMPQ